MTFPLADDDEEFTELVDASSGEWTSWPGAPRQAHASSSPRARTVRGLVPPEVIRDLIGKSEPAPSLSLSLRGR